MELQIVNNGIPPQSLCVVEIIRKYGLTDISRSVGIKIKHHPKYPNLMQLVHDKQNSPDFLCVQECNGLILDKTNNYKIIAHTFNKIYSYDYEFRTGGKSPKDLIDWESANVYEKLDGCLCSIYFYEEWNVQTLSSIDGSEHYKKIRLSDIFWSAWRSNNYSYPDPNYCYTFELQSPALNRYNYRSFESILYLISVRNMTTMEEIDIENYRGVFHIPNKFEVSSWKEITEMLYFSSMEGVVVVDKKIRASVIAPQYEAMRNLQFSRKAEQKNRQRLIILILNEIEPFFLERFPNLMPVYYELKEIYDTYCRTVQEIFNQHKDLSKRDFAAAIKTSPYKTTLFLLKNKGYQTVAEAIVRSNPQGIKSIFSE
eukprot:TRINITY_DN7729_c0_g1_i2.p1 TRINITY_DN7729_c0_g1~~TRINITY_DN7729_c0_g1_i2.p1  ORF type:complete len:370 (+),score=42.98 TRINITY_DN7729_c0_g1_i2:1427-2536(+)